MAYYVKIENNLVTELIVAEQSFINSLDGEWLETKIDGSIRKNYAGIGFTYDQARDAFIPPKPDTGDWVLDESTCLWVEVSGE